jgi:hypothetical protein
MRLRRRVERLTVVLRRTQEVSWEVMSAAQQRVSARALAKLRALLAHTEPPPRDPEADRQDEQLLARWRQQQGILPDRSDPLAELLAKLNQCRHGRAAVKVTR